jgi:hypothetical protein
VDEQVKHLPKNEQARKWGEGVIEYAKQAQLDKLSASSTIILHLRSHTESLFRPRFQTCRIIYAHGYFERRCAPYF